MAMLNNQMVYFNVSMILFMWLKQCLVYHPKNPMFGSKTSHQNAEGLGILRLWQCVNHMSFYDNFYVSGNAMGIMIMGIVYDNVPFYDILHDDGDCAFMALCKPHFV